MLLSYTQTHHPVCVCVMQLRAFQLISARNIRRKTWSLDWDQERNPELSHDDVQLKEKQERPVLGHYVRSQVIS